MDLKRYVFAVNAKKQPLCKWREKSAVGKEYERQAVDCGKSGLVVIDLDPPSGLQNWVELTAKYNISDDTYVVQTPRGGLHYYFRYAGGDLRNSTGKLGDGIDVRANGGYVVAPPTPDYHILVDREPIELPDALKALLVKQVEFLPDEEFKDGTRHNSLISVAGRVWNETPDADILYSVLLEVNEKQCKPPLPENEVRSIAYSTKLWKSDATVEKTKLTERQQELLNKARNSEWYHEHEPPPVDWIVEGVIEAGGIFTLYGDSGIGKTFLAMHLAKCIGSGEYWYGHKCSQRKVLYLDAENGEGLIHRRSQMVDPEGTGNITYISFPRIVLSAIGLELLEWLINEFEADVLIIDPLMYFTEKDENSIEDMRAQLGGLRGVAIRTKCAFGLIHHENRQGGYRGTSGLKDTSTLMIHIQDAEVPSRSYEHTLEMKPVKRRESLLKPFNLVWSIEDRKFVTGTLDTMEETPMDRLVKACKKLAEENEGNWPGKDELIKAKGIHGLTRKLAETTLEEALTGEVYKLELKKGKHNKHEIRVPNAGFLF